MAQSKPVSLLISMHFSVMAFNFNHRKALRQLLQTDGGWQTFSLRLEVAHEEAVLGLRFQDGKIKVESPPAGEAEVGVVFADEAALRELLTSPPLKVVQARRAYVTGRRAYFHLFNHLVTVFLKNRRGEVMRRLRQTTGFRKAVPTPNYNRLMERRREYRLRAEQPEAGVKHLEDPYLGELSLKDLPRLERLRRVRLEARPEVCPECAKLLTDWYRQHGFEQNTRAGAAWVPELRQAIAFKELMERRLPLIAPDSLVAGTTTSMPVGVMVCPEALGLGLWAELESATTRAQAPLAIAEQTAEILHRQVFPFWVTRTLGEYVRRTESYPWCQRIDERHGAYFCGNQLGGATVVPDYAELLAHGPSGISARIKARLADKAGLAEGQREPLQAMAIALQGVSGYAQRLAQRASQEARKQNDPGRARELQYLAEICQQVPEGPAQNLDQAVNAIWIVHTALCNEGTDVGLSFGRLDQLLQPYLDADLAPIKDPRMKRTAIARVMELLGCFFLRCNDHVPFAPLGESPALSGLPAGQAVTVGGITPAGEDAVNDMTYLLLKVAELLNLPEPVLHARYHPRRNSRTYLDRLCEVNLLTGAQPAIHNDLAVLSALAEICPEEEARRDWAVAGDGGPVVSGRQMADLDAVLFNLTAPLEMALYNGYHPGMDWGVGLETGDLRGDTFGMLEDLFKAFSRQARFLVEKAAHYGFALGKGRAETRPAPLLSALLRGCVERGRDATRGGAEINTSGVCCLGLVEVVDSLLAIDFAVFGERNISLHELKRALEEDFQGHDTLSYLVRKKIPLFGSDNDAGVAMARRVIALVRDAFQEQTDSRGGDYVLGFRAALGSAAFGAYTGALPCGRLRGAPLQPGLTPEGHASSDVVQHVLDVSRIDPALLAGGMSLEARLLPREDESSRNTVTGLSTYVTSYFAGGGMTMGLGLLPSALLREAVEMPPLYADLLVRSAGAGALFTRLPPALQDEIVARREYPL